ncbi:hypothetical protein ACRE_088300 [Hapsidospora chrysogenum ATCC 11550]|uniref:LSM domain-containing protein n=1 Tax=Hapsidospora chrysogenum (strain ATCC 11550 / CBS 779.69 / DSM 880 / IAM 14645 / JCM 23072 / IMI 49137) TaxID=857340 RepID=A0A086STP4_HAPC1|nr:hypothetical protein ACRE_088300 [Hapsidospora chrysogenum ATCC 11550]
MATLGGYLNSELPLQHSSPNPIGTTQKLTSAAEKVLIVTADSRILVGTLTAADNSTNLVRS